MNTITHEGKEYEVLDPLSVESRDCDHAMTAKGIMPCVFISGGGNRFRVGDSLIYFKNMVAFGIQPLRLLPKVPVEFVGEAELLNLGYEDVDILRVRVKKGQVSAKDIDGKTFRCVEVTEAHREGK